MLQLRISSNACVGLLVLVIHHAQAHSPIEIFAGHSEDFKEAAVKGFTGKDSQGVSASEFLCPGIGHYAVKKPGKENCKKYYSCAATNRNAVALHKCTHHQRFNRLSRTCEDKEYVNCNWCTKEGRHADKTSKSHFLECVPGSIAIRYKCKEGEFDPKKKECIERDWKITDLTRDVELDPPKDIVKFQKKWAAAQNDKKRQERSKSIEELGGEDGKKEKDKKKEKYSSEETESTTTERTSKHRGSKGD